MTKKIILTDLEKSAIEKSLEFLISDTVSKFKYVYKDVLKKVSLADEITLAYNIEEDSYVDS